jgi:ADP-heptose:LPS heptosyltransferase/predicted SAM-dependent methyltransferase
VVWKIDNPQCNESKKIVWEVAPHLRGRGLDVGAGDFKILPHAISVDNLNHSQFGFQIRPDIYSDASDLSMFASGSMDFVYSSHTLEHVQDYAATLKEWWRVLKPGGRLVLYLPHKEFYPNIGQTGANPDHKHDFLPEDVIQAMPRGWDLLENQERNEDQEYSFLQVYLKRSDKETNRVYLKKKPEKTVCVVRYGAFGDLMQSSSVWARLKMQGYHVTLFSSLPGAAVVEHDPHIDSLVLFDKDQVPNADLASFWGWQKKKFDKWVNLSESIEGSLLAMPGRTLHFFPPAVRHRLTNFNYVELQHEIAEVPYELNGRFYPTKEERVWATSTRKKMGGSKIVVWSLAGSSVHKTWAGLDNILACIMVDFPDARVVLTGGPECKILEAGWENEPRIVKTSGEWTIRQTLSFLDHADLVIGPETGVLNAAACLPARKICFLSHSTVENLTRDWTNTVSLWSKNTQCQGRGNSVAPACHVLHYGWEHCSRDHETGTAQCQKDIPVQEVWEHVAEALRESK